LLLSGMNDTHQTGGITMFRKNLSLFLVGSLLLTLFAAPGAFAKTRLEREAAFATKVKAGVAKLGVGKDAVISVRLRDKKKLEGYVTAIEEEAFVIADAKTGDQTSVPYGNVSKVKGHNLSTGAIVAITAAVAVGVTLLTLVILAAVYGD
jgi:hypothetical protein